ncbi:MAG: hypothetical protein NTV82_00700 [Candidatus Aminicenantes bacterium]|nr:hypothetical protein [Candidatus Aminicenantes bacterium]
MIVKPTALAKRRDDAAAQVKTAAAAPVNAVPTPQMNMKELAEYQVGQLIPQAGTVELTTQQTEILYAKVKDEDVEIRPDGLIYLPWVEYVSRLHEAFGMEWAIIPRGMPEMNPGGTGLLWGFFLMVKGKPAGFAIGEQEYYANNATMTWGDACEGAKSNALMRLCKGIGISLELWKPSFVKRWKGLYAESYPDPTGKLNQWNKVRTVWRKKGPANKEPGEPKEKQKAKAETKPPVQEKPAAKAGTQEKAKPAANAKYKTTPPAGRPSGDDIADMAETQEPELTEEQKKKHLATIGAIKMVLAGQTIDYKDFKKFLGELQQKNPGGRVFVRDKFGHPSLEAGNSGDVGELLKNAGVMMDKYIAKRMKEEKDAKTKKK